VAGFEVVPDTLRAASGRVNADAAAVRTAGTSGEQGATTAAGGAGDGPLAGALGNFADQLQRYVATLNGGLEQASASLVAGADGYRATDEGVVPSTPGPGR
jgi:hypothetical protein